MNSKEFKRELERLGAEFQSAKGSHLKVFLNGRRSILPMHGKDLGPLEKSIRKQLGLK
jgi:mRNA interferase HicA